MKLITRLKIQINN